MSKGKLQKFAEMETFKNVFQYPYGVISEVPFEMRGHWREQYFHNDNPIVLELGCGKGEYTVGLARVYPNINFIGVDIKGARTIQVLNRLWKKGWRMLLSCVPVLRLLTVSSTKMRCRRYGLPSQIHR